MTLEAKKLSRLTTATMAGKKEFVRYALAIIKNWFRDLVVYKYSPEKIMNKDLVEGVKNASGKMEVDALILKIKAVQRVRQALEQNANLRLALENFAMEIAGIKK